MRVPFVRPVTVIGDAPPEAVNNPGEEVTVYDVIGDPPSLGASNATVTCPSPGVVEVIVGALGMVGVASPTTGIARPARHADIARRERSGTGGSPSSMRKERGCYAGFSRARKPARETTRAAAERSATAPRFAIAFATAR